MAEKDDYALDYRCRGKKVCISLFWFGGAQADGLNQVRKAEQLLFDHNLHLDWTPHWKSDPIVFPEDPLPWDKAGFLLAAVNATLCLSVGRLPVLIGQMADIFQGGTSSSFPAVVVDPFAVNDVVLLHEIGHKAGLADIGKGGADGAQDAKDFGETGAHNFMKQGGAGRNMWKKQLQNIEQARWFVH